MSNKLYGGSICISDLLEMAKKGHSAFSKSAKNGKVYGSILVWENEQVDEYGNIMSFQLGSDKEKREEEVKTFGKGYIGNAKRIETKKPVTTKDINDDWQNNIQTKAPSNSAYEVPPSDDDPSQDLPF